MVFNKKGTYCTYQKVFFLERLWNIWRSRIHFTTNYLEILPFYTYPAILLNWDRTYTYVIRLLKKNSIEILVFSDKFWHFYSKKGELWSSIRSNKAIYPYRWNQRKPSAWPSSLFFDQIIHASQFSCYFFCYFMQLVSYLTLKILIIFLLITKINWRSSLHSPLLYFE